MTLSNGATLIAGYRDSYLNGVTLNGNLDGMAVGGSYVTVTNGLTLNGTVTLGSDYIINALLFFGTQTLGGGGTVVFASANTDIGDAVAAVNSGTTLTIGPNITVEGGLGTIGYQSYWSGNSTESDVSFVNQGTIISNVEGGSIGLDGGAWTNSGSIEVSNGGSVTLGNGTLTFDGQQFLSIQPTSTLTLQGNLFGTTQNADLFQPVGTVIFNGSGTSAAPQQLEAMSQDLGNVPAGYVNNFARGTLSVGSGDYLQLVGERPQLGGNRSSGPLCPTSADRAERGDA